MWALIGLFAGALVGNLLWQDWGAALGGLVGFFAGVRFSAWRAKVAGVRPPVANRVPGGNDQTVGLQLGVDPQRHDSRCHHHGQPLSLEVARQLPDQPGECALAASHRPAICRRKSTG